MGAWRRYLPAPETESPLLYRDTLVLYSMNYIEYLTGIHTLCISLTVVLLANVKKVSICSKGNSKRSLLQLLAFTVCARFPLNKPRRIPRMLT